MKTLPRSTANWQLRYARELRGWSQKRVAEAVGTNKFMVSRWEGGVMTPSPHFREQLCGLFGKTAEELGFILPPPHQETSTTALAHHRPQSVSLPAHLFFPEREKISLGTSEELLPEQPQQTVRLLSTAHTLSPEPSSSGSTLPLLHLLTTKVSAPPAPANTVSRPRLTQQMQTAIQGPLTLLIAPAGWGKTTLLSAWHTEAHPSSPLAWVSLERGDNDPLRFWAYVLTALNALHPGVGETSLELLHASSPPPIETVLTVLLNTLNQLPTETVIVLDDYHSIEAQPIHEALTTFVEHLPVNVHLVLASRSEPPLHLARLRAQGRLSELGATNLRFTVEESTTFLTEIMGLPLEASQVAALQDRTEGWIAGLHLAALSLRAREDVAGFIDSFTGSHRYVVDYLVEEVLARQPAEVLDFLVQTCLLERLNGPLCDAVRERSDSQAWLEHVERNRLFLVALDEKRQWYRYHHLFAEVLQSRLHRLPPTVVAELHRRASHWYEQHQLFDEAVTHALAVPDLERTARLLESYARLTNFPSQFQILLGWLEKLPDAFVRTKPTLCILHAITLSLTQQLKQASARVQDAEQCLDEAMPAQQRRLFMSLIVAFRGYQTRILGDYERGVVLGQQALEQMPETEERSPLTRIFRLGTFMTTASVYMVDGMMTSEMERHVEAAVASAQGMDNLTAIMTSTSNLARFYVLQGRLRRAASTIEQATRLVSYPTGLQTLVHGADYYLILGDLLREWNQLQRAEQYLLQGIDLVREATTTHADMIMRGYLALARLQQASGKTSQALQALDAFAQMARQRGFAPVLLACGAAVQAQVALAQGNGAAAIGWAERRGLSSSDVLSYPREQEYLTLVRVYIAQGRVQPAAPFLGKALSLLERLGEDAQAKGRMRSVLEILLLRALALEARGDTVLALTMLGRALVLAEPEGYIRLFLDEGAPLLSLLRRVHRYRPAPAGYVTTLLEAFGEQMSVTLHPTSLRSSSLLKSLTGREREVLLLLLDGSSNREIAQQLILSVNTVKKHVWNICSKMGVQSRTQVIAKARFLTDLTHFS